MGELGGLGELGVVGKTVRDYSLFIVHYSFFPLLIIHCSLFILFIANYSLFIVHYSLFIFHFFVAFIILRLPYMSSITLTCVNPSCRTMSAVRSAYNGFSSKYSEPLGRSADAA